MDVKEEVLLQINQAITRNESGPILFILVSENGIASHCFAYQREDVLRIKLELFDWKQGDPIGVVLIDPEIYDYDDLLHDIESQKYKILCKFHYFPESSNLVQWHAGVRYPYKIINCGVEIHDEQPDLILLKRDLKDRIDRVIEYVESTENPNDRILREIWLLTLRYKNTFSPDLDKEITDLESEIMMLQIMLNQLETNVELI